MRSIFAGSFGPNVNREVPEVTFAGVTNAYSPLEVSRSSSVMLKVTALRQESVTETVPSWLSIRKERSELPLLRRRRFLTGGGAALLLELPGLGASGKLIYIEMLGSALTLGMNDTMEEDAVFAPGAVDVGGGPTIVESPVETSELEDPGGDIAVEENTEF